MKHKLNKGFTIIEVILVLAIAGLIFLTVFLAIPALQRSFRENARKQDIRIIIAAVRNKIANSRGARTCEIFKDRNSLDGYLKIDELSQIKKVDSFGAKCLGSGHTRTGIPSVSEIDGIGIYDQVWFDVGASCHDYGHIKYDNSNKIVILYNSENKQVYEPYTPGMYSSPLPPIPGQPEPPRRMALNTCIEDM